jgi:hypothetical protein
MTASPITGAQGVNLDAGKVTLIGPAGSNLNGTQFAETNSTYNLIISGQGTSVNGSLVAGTYSLSGAGGAGVGAFNATVSLGAPFTLTGGLPTTVTRGAGLTLNWTGGNPSDSVIVQGIATTITNDFQTGASFLCYTTAGAKTITVSPSILNQLPAVSVAENANFSGYSTLMVTSSVTPATGDGYFNAPLTAGGSITNATFVGTTNTGGTAAYQ